MDLALTPAEEAFRAEVREFIAAVQQQRWDPAMWQALLGTLSKASLQHIVEHQRDFKNMDEKVVLVFDRIPCIALLKVICMHKIP